MTDLSHCAVVAAVALSRNCRQRQCRIFLNLLRADNGNFDNWQMSTDDVKSLVKAVLAYPSFMLKEYARCHTHRALNYFLNPAECAQLSRQLRLRDLIYYSTNPGCPREAECERHEEACQSATLLGLLLCVTCCSRSLWNETSNKDWTGGPPRYPWE